MLCPICESDGWARYLVKPPYSYVQCPSCGLIRLDPFPSPHDARSLYGDEYFTASAYAGYDDYVADEAVHRRNGRRRIARLGEPPPTARTMIDIGCAHGFTLVEAQAAGWDPMGVDVNASARAAVRARGMRCEAGFDDLTVEPGTVGAVTLFQVLEHLPDPVETLRRAAQVLLPDGAILIETWDRSSLIARMMGRRWQVATPPSVLWLWDRATLERLAAVAGLELVGFDRTMKWVTLGLVAGQMRDRGSTGLWVRIGRRLRSVPMPYALGDLVTVHLARPVAHRHPGGGA